MKIDLKAKQKRALKIGGVLAISLLGLSLLPVLALPYGGLDWLNYDPSYQQGYSSPVLPAPREETAPPCGLPCAEQPEDGEPLAATVNGQGIGMAAFEREVGQLLLALQSLEENGAEVPADSDEMAAHRRFVLDTMIDDVLVQQAAAEACITVTQEEIEVQLSETVNRLGGLEAFEDYMDLTEQTWDEFRRDICQDILDQQVLDLVTAWIDGPFEMVWVQQITVATEEEAADVLTRLASGESFEDVAMEVSIDEATRDAGGDLGWLPRGTIRAEQVVMDAAFAGEPGQVQGPIQVEQGYAIVKTVEYDPARELDPQSREELRMQAAGRWLAERRADSDIEIFVDLQAAP